MGGILVGPFLAVFITLILTGLIFFIKGGRRLIKFFL